MTLVHILAQRIQQEATRKGEPLSPTESEAQALNDIIPIINQKHAEIRDQIKHIRHLYGTQISTKYKNDIETYLCDLQGWLNTVLWALECDRYMNSGIPTETSLRLIHENFNPEKKPTQDCKNLQSFER